MVGTLHHTFMGWMVVSAMDNDVFYNLHPSQIIHGNITDGTLVEYTVILVEGHKYALIGKIAQPNPIERLPKKRTILEKIKSWVSKI